MALSGTVQGSCDNSRYTLTAEWSATQNTTANTSTITVNVYLTPPSGWNTISSMWSCVINGTTVTSNKSANVTSKTLLGSRTFTVNHNSDGTASTTISFSYSNGLSGAGTYTTHTGSGSATITLNTIARGSSFTLNRSSVTLGSDSLTLSITRNNSTYKHKVKVIIGSSNYLVGENVGTSFTFTPSINYCNNITSSTSATATIKVETLNSSGSWLAETTKTVTFNVPSSIVPTTGIGLTAYNQTNGINVADQTTFMIKPSNATGAYGSTIKKYSITAGSYSSSATSLTTGTFKSGTYTFSVKVTDTRGRTATATRSVTIYSYYTPTVNASAYRCTADGTKSNNGACVAVKFSWNISNLGNANTNGKQYSVQYKLKSNTSYTTSITYTTLSAYTGSMTVVLPNTFSTTSSYDIQVLIKDSYSTITSSALRISTINALLNIEQGGVGIGKIRERGVLDVGGDMYGTGGLTLDGSIRVGAGKYIYGTGSDGSNITLAFVNQTNNGSEFGTSTLHTTIKSGDNPTWYTGTDSKSYSIWTDKDCVRSSSGGCQTWRFPNGMQVSIIQTYGNWNITTAWGSVYSSPFINGQSFDKAFLEVPRVIINAHGGGTAIMVCQAGAPTTTATGGIYLWKPVQQTGVRDYIEYIAIGRWK